MKISILTLFPDFFIGFLNTSIIYRAIKNNFVNIDIIDFRKYSKEKHHKVDDSVYGGGNGMVLKIEPIVNCLNAIKKSYSKVILLTPSGKTFKQQDAISFLKFEHLILICGHYEGFDERISNYVDYEISIGDYILTGGETASLVVAETIIRLIPNVIKKNSIEFESFNDGLLDYPVYTKPVNFNGYKVPDVLLSGNHSEIEKFRFDSKLLKTRLNRNDLYKNYIKKIQKGDNYGKQTNKRTNFKTCSI